MTTQLRKKVIVGAPQPFTGEYHGEVTALRSLAELPKRTPLLLRNSLQELLDAFFIRFGCEPARVMTFSRTMNTLYYAIADRSNYGREA